jgi:hypothetical protein
MKATAMKIKAREYQARAAQYEARARKTRSPNDREWQMILASAYQVLAEMEGRSRWTRSADGGVAL